MKNHFRIVLAVLTCMPLLLTGCQTAYYGTMEKFGIHKRDILVDRVKDARDSQEVSKEQFQTALERFSDVIGFKGGALQDKYDKLSKEFTRCEDRANAVHDHIKAVGDVGDDLFKEWKAELREYSNDSLRRSSEQKMKETQKHYQALLGAMKKAESKMNPVLDAFRDQVLYLKHNLNAQAVAALQDDLTKVETEVAALIRDMERSIKEADSFISAMVQ